jgi:hypothetical protein
MITSATGLPEAERSVSGKIERATEHFAFERPIRPGTVEPEVARW